MTFESWVFAISGLLLLMGLGTAYVSRAPFTDTMVYLGLGLLLGPAGWAVLSLSPWNDTELLLRAAEIAVVISLFTVGLKLRIPFLDRRWLPSVLLAFGSMAITVGLLTGVGVWGLHLPVGAAILLGGILAPTDPVLAAKVQLENAADRDALRLALSGEAGFNDGAAFPFVMLGLGLLGLHDLGDNGWRWWTLDVAWAIGGGLGIGSALGYLIGLLIVQLRRRERDGAALDEYLLLGLIGFSYALALKLNTYGFLAVFAAGVAVRALERRETGAEPEKAARLFTRAVHNQRLKQDSRLAPAYMAGALQSFNEQVEHILEVGVVLMVGAALLKVGIPAQAWWFTALLFLVIRPLSVIPVWWTRQLTGRQFVGVSWFGIRGIGSVYYLMFAINEGLDGANARLMAALTLTTIAASIVIHGVSVTPLLKYLQRPER